MTDVKTYAFGNDFRGTIPPGEPIHDMWLRLTLDDDLVIHAVDAATDQSPYRICPEITPAFQQLVGLRIKLGFNQRVRELLGGTKGCTHLVELLGPMATTAYQTISPLRTPRPAAEGEAPRRPGHLGTCHALATDGEVVQRQYPHFYTGTADGG